MIGKVAFITLWKGVCSWNGITIWLENNRPVPSKIKCKWLVYAFHYDLPIPCDSFRGSEAHTCQQVWAQVWLKRTQFNSLMAENHLFGLKSIWIGDLSGIQNYVQIFFWSQAHEMVRSRSQGHSKAEQKLLRQTDDEFVQRVPTSLML